MSNEIRVLKALMKRERVTRKTAIEKGLCENLTATIARLRKMGMIITAVTVENEEGDTYTRYRLDSPVAAKTLLAKAAA